MSNVKTSDIYFAAALLSMGARMSNEPNREDKRHVRFEFEHDSLDLEECHTQWINEEVTGNLYKYAENIKKMKQVLHSD